MATMNGIDVSHWQAGLNLKSTGAQFAIMKATDGTSMVDAECDTFYQQAKSAGILRGVYHFWEGGDPTAEADHFVNNTSGYIGDAVLALDWEAGNLGDVSAARAFLDRVYSRTGVRPLIYMSQSVTTEHNWQTVVDGNYGLWVARYGSSVGSVGAFPGYVMWQHTDNWNGQNVDGDTFYGDANTWKKYAAKNGQPDPTPTPSGGLTVDGAWGSDTTKRLQQYAGHAQDGTVSGQYSGHKAENSACTTGWEWSSSTNPGGSQIIAWIQAKVGVSPHDGILGPDTVKGLERHYGTSQDGYLELYSETVRRMQTALNEGKF